MSRKEIPIGHQEWGCLRVKIWLDLIDPVIDTRIIAS
jgi:hypothetical protein